MSGESSAFQRGIDWSYELDILVTQVSKDQVLSLIETEQEITEQKLMVFKRALSMVKSAKRLAEGNDLRGALGLMNDQANLVALELGCDEVDACGC